MFGLKRVAVVAALALLAGACGDWTPPMPTAPSDAASGATISGTLKGSGASATAWSTAATNGTGITVTVVGTDISVAVSGSGQFVLKGVPSGNISLRFTGPGLDATIAITAVTLEHIQLVVTLNGSQVTIESLNRVQSGNKAELEGLITSLNPTDRTMKVNSIEVKVGEAPIRHGSTPIPFESLAVGQRVHVKGTWNQDVVIANEVKLQNRDDDEDDDDGDDDDDEGDNDDDEDEVEIEGFLTGFSGGCPGVSFTLAGRNVAADSSTRFGHGPCEHLDNNTWVEVEGVLQGSTVIARKIEMKEVEFTGTITSGSACAPGQLVIGSRTVKTYSWTSFEKAACGALQAGTRVEVKGTEHATNVVKAIRIKYEGK